MDDTTIARALHVLGVIHWIGGLAMVTLVVLPPATDPADRLAMFKMIERRFGAQARWSVTLVGLTGFWMTWRLHAWWRFAEPGYWWMDAMLALWALFTVLLFVAEPLVLHGRFEERAKHDPGGTLAFGLWAHRVLLALASVTVAGAVLGAHGLLY